MKGHIKRRAFTWIELIVVLGIVLVLAAIFFPVVASYREEQERIRRGRLSNICQQNIRQIGLAIKQYLSDYDETFPPISNGGQFYGWADTVQPYLRVTVLFQCPLEGTLPMSSDGPATPNYTDYFYNAHLARVNESKLQYIANTIMLGDAAPGDARQHSTGGMAKKPGPASLVNRYGIPVGAATRHRGGANYAFADGHIKWLKGTDANTSSNLRNTASGVWSVGYSFAIQ